MEKRLFEILDEMNLHDIENGTRLVAVSNIVTEVKLNKQGTIVSIGCESDAIMQIEKGKLIPILILVDKEDYFKRKT